MGMEERENRDRKRSETKLGSKLPYERVSQIVIYIFL